LPDVHTFAHPYGSTSAPGYNRNAHEGCERSLSFSGWHQVTGLLRALGKAVFFLQQEAAMPVTSAIVGPTCQPAPPSAATSEKYSSSGWATTGRAKVSTKFSGGIRFSGGKDASRVVLDSNLDSDEQEGNVLESQSKCPKTRKWSPNPFIWLTRLAARNTSKRHQAILNSDSTTEVIKIKPKHALAVSQCNNDKQEEPPDWAEPFIRASSSTPRVMWMSQLQCWEMDIFEVQNATNPPLQLVGLKIFHHHDLIGRLNLDKQR
jgi:hypothetical protein